MTTIRDRFPINVAGMRCEVRLAVDSYRVLGPDGQDVTRDLTLPEIRWVEGKVRDFRLGDDNP